VSRVAELYAADTTEERMQKHMQAHQDMLKQQAEAYAAFLASCTKILPTEQSAHEKQGRLQEEEKAEMARIQQLVLGMTTAESAQEQVALSAELEKSSSNLKRICTSRSDLNQKVERSKRLRVEVDEESRRIEGFLKPLDDTSII
jgi:hypothetical protein